jgi:hypothetical protein
MPRTASPSLTTITELVTGFVAAVERATVDRMKDLVLGALGGSSKTTNGSGLAPVKRKLPKQFCPVPGCRNAAAPVFGMVCRDHKDVPKAQIKKYREARRAANGAPGVVRRGRPPGRRPAKAGKVARKAAGRPTPALGKPRGRKPGRKKVAAGTKRARTALKKGHAGSVAAKVATPPASTPATTSIAAAS